MVLWIQRLGAQLPVGHAAGCGVARLPLHLSKERALSVSAFSSMSRITLSKGFFQRSAQQELIVAHERNADQSRTSQTLLDRDITRPQGLQANSPRCCPLAKMEPKLGDASDSSL